MRPSEREDDGFRRYAIYTIAIAGMSALASELATWAVDELREKFGTKQKDEGSK